MTKKINVKCNYSNVKITVENKQNKIYIVRGKEIVLPHDHTKEDLEKAMCKVLDKEVVIINSILDENGEWHDIH